VGPYRWQQFEGFISLRLDEAELLWGTPPRGEEDGRASGKSLALNSTLLLNVNVITGGPRRPHTIEGIIQRSKDAAHAALFPVRQSSEPRSVR